MRPTRWLALALLLAASARPLAAQRATARPRTRLVPVAGSEGWARSSVNTVIFRGSSVFTHGSTQYTAWYDGDGRVVLARRRLGGETWAVRRSQYQGEARDAHNTISLAVDGDGVLHVAWDAHGTTLRYARGVRPGSLELTEPLAMTGQREAHVTYPQFHRLANGDLLFLYRDGSSGKGDVLLDRWDVRAHEWRVVQHPLVDGEGERNAYVNGLAIDAGGGWHLTWCWRESPDVATNHDVLYAFSPDAGKSWRRSTGEPYALPITMRTAEVAWSVPERSELINQTTMAVDAAGHPMVATYWRPEGTDVPQLQLVRHDGHRWRATQIGERTLAFRLSGGGTKRIPLSRPLVLAGARGVVYIVYRDEERGPGITVATSADSARTVWTFETLYAGDVGLWEPTHDPVLWRRARRLHLFVQRVGQGDGETLENVAPQPVSVLEWRP